MEPTHEHQEVKHVTTGERGVVIRLWRERGWAARDGGPARYVCVVDFEMTGPRFVYRHLLEVDPP